jgi:hypothetical protein
MYKIKNTIIILILSVLLSLNLLLEFSLSLLKIVLSSLLLKLNLMVISLSLGLLRNNSLDKDLFVLVDVTLGEHIKLLVHLRIDFTLSSVLSEKSSEGSLSSDPKDFLWHSGISTTSSLTDSHVSSLSLFSESFESSESRVDFNISLSDYSVLDEGSDVCSGGGVGELLDLLGVQPNSVLTTLQN